MSVIDTTVLEQQSAVAKRLENSGQSSPLGATLVPGGVNFSVFSRGASGMELLFFDREDDGRPSRVIRIDPVANRTYHYWHVFAPDVQPGQIYGFRVHGPFDPANGFRFDPSKLLLDPYGRAVVVPKSYDRTAARMEGDNTATAMKSVVVDPRAYDWEGDRPLRRLSSRTIIYELHVRGFTVHPSAGVAAQRRGTYAGLIENSLSAATRHHRGRTAVGLPIRCSGLPARTGELLGLCTGFVLRTTSGL